jgi:hypothetical protein
MVLSFLAPLLGQTIEIVVLPDAQFFKGKETTLEIKVYGSDDQNAPDGTAVVVRKVPAPDGDIEDLTTGLVTKDGKVTVKIKGKIPGEVTLIASALGIDIARVIEVEIEKKSSPSGSYRVRTDLMLGNTFQNTYSPSLDDDGEPTGGQTNDGFDSTSPLALLNFDTLWRLDRFVALHTGVDLVFTGTPVTPAEMGDGNMEDNETEQTRTKMEASDQKFSDYSDSVQADIYVHWQPARWGGMKYTKTNRDPDKPHDAMRFGLIARAGFNNRTEIDSLNGDTLISRFGVGLTFRHHRTAGKDGRLDNINETPLRWVEIRPTLFEEWAGEEDEIRWVITAGIRLDDSIPFYAGIHTNVGSGPDDVRVIAGLVFKMNKLANMFQ